MKAIKSVLVVSLLATAFAAHAQWPNPSQNLSDPRIECDGETPVITVTYSTKQDAGLPGLLYVGVLSPDKEKVSLLNLSNQWTDFPGGLYIPNKRYDGGVPASYKYQLTFPGNAKNTMAFANYDLYLGHGVLSQDSQAMIVSRRKALDSAKDNLVKRGAWNPIYDNDDHFKQALVQKDLVDNKKFGPVFKIPELNCQRD